jgi:nitrogen fixation protein NifB
VQALLYLNRLREKMPHLSVVGIAGPGDPFANPEETLDTLMLIKRHHPDLLLCVATNGLNLLPYVKDLAALHTSHVTITVNTVDPSIGARVYAWFRYDGRCRTGTDAAAHLWEVQRESIRALKSHEILVKINTIFLPGINDEHITEVARAVAEQKADIMNIMPLCPVPGTPFGVLAPPESNLVAIVRDQAGQHIRQMSHCARCRADSCGLLGTDDKEASGILARLDEPEKELSDVGVDIKRPYVAVTSWEGMLVNQHLGEASRIHIYDPLRPEAGAIDIRQTPPVGSGDERWFKLAEVLSDCRMLLTAGAGNNPRKILTSRGIEVHLIEGLISMSLAAIKEKGSLQSLSCRQATRCGESCKGNGLGCG